MKEQIPSLLPGFREQLSPPVWLVPWDPSFPCFDLFFGSQRVGAVQEGKYKLSGNVAQLFPGEIPSWWRSGARQSLARLWVPLGLRCC